MTSFFIVSSQLDGENENNTIINSIEDYSILANISERRATKKGRNNKTQCTKYTPKKSQEETRRYRKKRRKREIEGKCEEKKERKKGEREEDEEEREQKQRKRRKRESGGEISKEEVSECVMGKERMLWGEE